MIRATVMARAAFATLLVAAICTPAPSSAVVARTDDDLTYVNPRYEGSATLAIEGTLVAVADTVYGSDVYAYAVRTEQGDAISVPTSFGDQAVPGGHFDGEVVIQGDLAEDVRDEGVSVTPGKVIDGDTKAGQTAIEVVADHDAPIPVASATVTEPVAEAANPSAHRAYVATITNLGSVPSSSALGDILSYWDDEAGDAINTFTVAGSVQYSSNADDDPNSLVDRATCGLQDGTWDDVWAEAEAEFPTVDFGFGSGNHLIVLVPSSCGASGVVGIGTVGDSIADGGLSIVAVTSGVEQTGVHELGHNMSLGHSNIEYCPTTSSCAIENYGNAYSVMGYSRGPYAPTALDTASREHLDLDDDVQSVTDLGPNEIQLLPRSSGAGLKIVDPMTSAVYYVEYRSGTGRDAASYYALDGDDPPFKYSRGIVITQITPNVDPKNDVGFRTKLLTRHIDTTYRSSLTPGESFTSRSGAVQITSGAQDVASGATLTVTLKAPVPSATPTLTPSVPRVGQVVTAVENAWAPGTTFTYQWRVDGVSVKGATARSFTPGSLYYKKRVSVSVTGSKEGFLPATRVAAWSTIAVGQLVAVLPKISGTHKVGYTLKVVTGQWRYGPKLTYRWYANGVRISHATKSTYKITKSKRGKYITVRVAGSKYGYNPASKTSLRTVKVR